MEEYCVILPGHAAEKLSMFSFSKSLLTTLLNDGLLIAVLKETMNFLVSSWESSTGAGDCKEGGGGTSETITKPPSDTL